MRPQGGTEQIAIHLPDELQRNILRADCLAFAVVGARAKHLLFHGDHHAESPLIPLRLALRKGVEMGQLG